MKEKLLQLYRYLPAPGRTFAASLYGYYLRAWRYGTETDRLVAKAIEREKWDAETWRRWQEERLAYLLHRAATKVPYYREQWAERRRHGDRASWEYIENWPVLKKAPLRDNPLAFVADDCNVRRMFREQTSGTSGTPLTLWWSKETVVAWFALFEARLRRWNGVSREDNWAILGGQSVIPPNTSRPPFWVWNSPMNQLYLSANHISGRTAQAYIDALRRYQVTHMIAYPSSVAVLAREAYKQNLTISGIKVVITNAEPVFPWQQDCIRKGFGSEIRETYGMAEIVAAASECQEATLHLWPEVGWIECLRDDVDEPEVLGVSGRLISTGLLNTDMPLIRYEVGDRTNQVSQISLCKCGRTLPAISGIEGRTNDMLIAPDGRRVYWVNPVFYGLPVQEAQIIQESLQSVRVRYVPASTFTDAIEGLIAERLQKRLGQVKIIMDQLNSIPRGPNGKFQAVICNVSSKERARVSAD